MKVNVASEWLNSCSGCEISIIDMGERLLDVLQVADIVHLPALMDSKYFGQMGDKSHLSIPKADVGIISGSIRNQEHVEVAEEMRKKCNIIIALGTCATHGGIPSLSNSYDNEETLDRYYSTESTDVENNKNDTGKGYPAKDIPKLLDACYALDEKIKVDIYLPGCPPHPDHIFHALTALVSGKELKLPEKSVCDTCPTIRKGKGDLKKLRRFLEAPLYGAAGESLDKMRCLLEQGFLCMGPVTRGGCGGDAKDPRCISARVPCRGCYGPVRHEGNQRLDMLNALVSNGIDINSLPESTSLLRFSGGHGMLRPKFKKKKEI
ncbi:F420-non-reducing hydrogenase, iron-sulfur subunit, MvhG [Desulfamplus magnetovallimortis]|uniref:F420-non-reducing hydrogenase, iron-sulfur subunit, MvhG n=1 Tax=Desulfamplus magnetovallimortis TaxID=1246637 RepID=A0A1W1HCT2_9BACT|nr:methyl viologen-reducing hydrogenase [Desulfamplus magnetovallimortis]SLM30297.1 F420-non-reducing hydrogenase, iron-sulfur subunit, MvhG [Desulfamplus magnetovallimortis]